jgi:5-methylcytosine-specific restriction endonuclease McrA
MTRKPPVPSAYSRWRKAVFAKDGKACVLCGSTERLEADHIQSQSKFPELKFEVSNGRVLCNSCHRQTDTYGGGSMQRNRRSSNG